MMQRPATLLALLSIASSAMGLRLGVMMQGNGFGARSTFKYTGSVRPGKVGARRTVPADVGLPPYAKSGQPRDNSPAFPWQVEVKTADQIERMRAAGRAAREVLDAAGRMVAAGVATDEIDALVHEECLKRGAYPSPLNYHGFPKSCCTSVNEIVCHGIPDSRKLKDGDMVNVDITVYLDGVHGDCSEMFLVGDVDEEGKKLVQTTYDVWMKAINFCAPGKAYKDIGGVIEDALPKEYTSVKNFAGHGIGEDFHTNPTILHYRNNERAGLMEPGHCFTIEPMICEGRPDNVVWPDGWTAATKDGRRSAQFEHTILITEDGFDLLTGKIDSSPKQFWEQ